MLCMHNKAIWRTAYVILGTLPLYWCMGCHNVTDKASEAEDQAKYELKTREYDREAHNPVSSIVLLDEAVRPDTSGERILRGDMRPLFIAEGRVQSKLMHSNADEIVIHVYMENTDKQIVDTADVVVKNIPPNGVKSFREKVQLLPPRNGHPFVDFDVVSVKTSPIVTWPFNH